MGGCVQQGVKKQGCRAKARTKRKPRSSVPQRPLVPLGKAVPPSRRDGQGASTTPTDRRCPGCSRSPQVAVPGHSHMGVQRGVSGRRDLNPSHRTRVLYTVRSLGAHS